jgi:uroporphyrinogen-III synthase
MMDSLKGRRVALLEARMTSELADLVRRQGGESYSVPSVREIPVESKEVVNAFIDALSQHTLSIVVFLTGVGVSALLREAERSERLPELLAGLRNVTVVCRGPKPFAVLRRNEIPIALSAPEPYTTTDLLAVLDTLTVQGIGIGVLHYGERNEALIETLRNRGASITELCLYEWQLPEDRSALQQLIRDILAGQVDVIAFTSQVQGRHLFMVAQEMGLVSELIEAMQTRMIIASVGPTCTTALRQLGVTPHIEPEHPKMGHLVKALSHYISSS